MARYRWIIAAAVVGIVVAVVLATRGPAPAVVDLVAQFPSAVIKPADSPAAPHVSETRLGGDARKTVLAPVPSRVIWHVVVPDNAWLRTWIGVDERQLASDTEGVQFRIAVSDGNNYQEVFARHLDPLRSRDDRGWIAVRVSLAAYAGRAVDIIFNTDVNPESEGGGPRAVACWGAPAIMQP